jgi:hypothetical protein
MKQIAFLGLILCSMTSLAQTIYLKSGQRSVASNIDKGLDFSTWTDTRYANETYCILQFAGATSLQQRQKMSLETGIQFFDYIPDHAFLVSIPYTYDVRNLKTTYAVRVLLPYSYECKIAPALMQRPLPSWIEKGNTLIELWIETQDAITQSDVLASLQNAGFTFLSWKNAHTAKVNIPETAIEQIAKQPWVKYVHVPSAPAVLENLTERSNHRVNTIDAAYSTGLQYDGTGVSVAIGDDGEVGPHIDYQGRLFNHSSGSSGSHGDHVVGIVGGGGNFDPVASGNARGSDLHIYDNYDNLDDAPVDYNTQGVRITSNSLGQGCNSGYNGDARDADILINSKVSLMSVHSAGNSGGTTCGGVPQGFFTITGGYKAGKNVMAVGNVTNSDVIASSSSRGPSEDGRIKPEIVAVGTDVYSTQPDNTYAEFTGTSMSCPGVAGTLASLWQAYRETHAGADPWSALMKAAVMNTADDLGNRGPDFIYGYGRINARRAYRTIANNQFFLDSINAFDAKDYFINIPTGTRQLRVMLYWNDYQGSPASSVALVNNLNLYVQEPSGNVIDPWVLNNTPTVAALNTPAVRGVDNINNVEQVTLDSVFSGPCIITVEGLNVPQGPQKFALVYEFINDQLTLTYPQGGEAFVHGVQERIRWDAFANNAGTFTLEYSPDAGTTWNTISNSIPGNRRHFDWTPPSILNTGRMMMRISRGTFFDETDSLFTVFGVPKNVTVDTACGTSFHLTWDNVSLATDYKIYMLGAKYMEEIGTSTTNEFWVNTGVNTTGTYYFAVSAHRNTNGANSLRSLAYEKLPGLVNCVHNAFNMQTILPFDRAYNCATTAPVTIKMKIKNIGFKDLDNLPVFYQVNANPVVSEVMAGPLAIGDSIIYTFVTTANMAVVNTYTVTTWSSLITDVITSNDTSQAVAIVELPTTLVPPLVQDFEGPLFPPLGWKVVDADANVKWQKTLVLVDPAGFNSHTAYMDFYNYSGSGQVDDLESAQFDLNGITNDSVLLSFDLSHAYGPKAMDSLQVWVSDNCGLTYTQKEYDKGGIPLATAGLMSTIFSPTAPTQWRNEVIDIKDYVGKKIFVRFRGINGKGNNVFIDNVNIILKNAYPLGVDNYSDELVRIYPNPSDGNYFMEYTSKETKEIRYAVYTISGQKILGHNATMKPGVNKVAINLRSFANGIYMLQVEDGGMKKQVKLSKY